MFESSIRVVGIPRQIAAGNSILQSVGVLGVPRVEALKEAAGMMTLRHMGKANNLKGHAAEAVADSAGTRFLLR